jgi:hypothetical protein
LAKSEIEVTNKNEFILARVSTESPAELQSLSASVFAVTPDKELVPVKLTIPVIPETIYDDRLLVDVVKEKTGIGKITIGKITKAGLSLVANLSKEKFNYETDKEGKVTEVSFESRLLAFSIPTKTEEKTGE